LEYSGDSFLSRILTWASIESQAKNCPIENVLFEAARDIKSREFLRVTMIILDSRSKGSDICEKLEKEMEQMQKTRLSDARARAKTAETKLCFPLMLLLIVLTAVCVAPALLNM